MTSAPRTLDRNGWTAIASGVLLLGVVIYFLFFIGDPAKRFRDYCHRWELSEYVPGYAPDAATATAVTKCERELHLDIDGIVGTIGERAAANVVTVDVPARIVGSAAGKGWHPH
jgi:hypothetical protein